MPNLSTVKTLPPTPQEAELAKRSSATLEKLLGNVDHDPQVTLAADDNERTNVAIPSSLIRLLLGALQEVAKGNAVSLLPLQSELTSQQAADLLCVSRPSLIKLLDANKLPYRKVGAHRRILYRDLLDYLSAERARRRKVMEELVAETEELGLYE